MAGVGDSLEEDLEGSLYVFMVEDDVTAWSKVEEAPVLNHNVFRGYALQDMQFTMSPGDEQTFAGVWPIPKIEVDPNEEYPEGTPVPIKTMDITAIAAATLAHDWLCLLAEANGAKRHVVGRL